MSGRYESTHLVQITDTTDPTAHLKIRSAYARHLGYHGFRDVVLDVAPACSTLDIGVKTSELICNTERPDRLMLALNCAPPDKADGTVDNARKDFFFADLGDNIFAGGTSNGLEWSYVKNRIQTMYRLTTTNARKSQFRSLQILPEHIVRFCVPEERAKLIQKGELVAMDSIDSIVSDVPDRTHVIEIDNFKNVKLYVSETDRARLAKTGDADFRFGTMSVEYDAEPVWSNETCKAIIRPTLFAAPLGTNIIALSSSSRIAANRDVPMIATIRQRPAETEPGYAVPAIGCPVQLWFAA